MLFPYTYTPHTMEKMQGYIDFIFNDVWYSALGAEYDIEVLFADNDELKTLIIELHTSEVEGADFFLKGIQLIYEDFTKLTIVEMVQLKMWYDANNNIELACADLSSRSPATYSDVMVISTSISKHLKDFFKNLYSQSFLSLKSVRDKIGDINNHYDIFITANLQGKCPFCGIQDVKGVHHTKREAYDHYLPKDKFPFNTINFRNLAPTCHECNSTYKLAKNPIVDEGGKRRKVFYPYSSKSYNIEINMTLEVTDWTDITPEDIQLEIGPDTLNEEISTWLDVYGLDERYKAKCCGEHDGKGWIREIVDESANFGQTPQQYLQGKLQTAENQPWVDVNFLRKPFLDACNEKGLFNKV